MKKLRKLIIRAAAVLCVASAFTSFKNNYFASAHEYAIDIDEYLPYIEPNDDIDYSILVSGSTKPLSPDYVPDNLVQSSNARKGRESQCRMVLSAAKSLEAFLLEASYYGYTDITVTNAYRSYQTQSYLFNKYYFEEEQAIHEGEGLTDEEIKTIVASYCNPPGSSEHQTGLCCDMHNLPVGSQSRFNGTEAAEWLADNAHRFGFILRYPPDKTDATGIVHESWHFRFVGRSLATELYERGITLDEYHAAPNRR